MQSQTEQINIKAPKPLKDWAKQSAENNYQSLSGFLVKLIAEEKERSESSNKKVEHDLAS